MIPARRVVLAWLLIGSVACGLSTEREQLDLEQELSPTDLAKFEAFMSELRSAYEQGNDPAVEAMIEMRGTPEFIARATRARALPKGPLRVVGYRIERLDPKRAPGIELGGVWYRHNVEPLGVLILEVDDVSVGSKRIKMVVGSSSGEFRIAGLAPVE